MKLKSKSFRTIGFVIILFILFIIFYGVYDNNRVIVVRQEVKVKDLPDSFDGFTLLQITDLHGKRFGKNQAHLINTINSCKYDMIAITGDMLSGYGKSDLGPFYELLDGIKNKKNMFFVGGNTDFAAYDRFTGEKTGFGKKLEEKGCLLLNQVYSIEWGKDKIWISPFQLTKFADSWAKEAQKKIETEKNPKELKKFKQQKQYMNKLKKELELLKPAETIIALEHYPFATDNPSHLPAFEPSFDLVIAGHYHGGQFRIPFYGAFYIPDPASSRKGFFPDQENVCGLKDWGVFQQYISKGLGASDRIPLFQFRLFNTPEINLITLVKEK